MKSKDKPEYKPEDQMKSKDTQEPRDKHHIFHAILTPTAATRRTSHHNNLFSSIHGNLLPTCAHISRLQQQPMLADLQQFVNPISCCKSNSLSYGWFSSSNAINSAHL
jgi:hypothetical protein